MAQSCHDLIPPETLSPIISEIANNFVSDRSSNEVVAIGINTIREVCVRCPLAMNEDLLQDLVQYKKIKDKGVIVAARSLINFYREKFPALLQKKDRGRGTDGSVKPLAYGEQKVATSIDGIELLEQYGDIDPDDLDEVEIDQNGELDTRNPEDILMEEDSDDDEDDDEEDDEIIDEDEENINEDDDENMEEEIAEGEEEDMDTISPKKKLRLDAMRILTDEDLEKIKKLKEKVSTDSRKRPREDDDDNKEPSDILDPSSLESTKRRRQSREERIQTKLDRSRK